MKRLQKLARVTDYLTKFKVPGHPDIVPIMTVNQENAASQLQRTSGEQLLVAMPEGRCTGQDSDSFDNSVSFAMFALSKVNGPARTPETAEVAYANLLGILDLCLDRIVEDLQGSGTNDPCPLLAGLELTTVDVIPEYSLFGGWSGYYMEIVLE